MQKYERYLDILSDSEIFRGIEGERLAALLEAMHARVVKYAKGETIYHCGDEVHMPALVLEGTVMVEDSDIEGEDTNLNMLQSGDEFGGILAMSGKTKSPMRVYAGTRCAVMLFDLPGFMAGQNRSGEAWAMVNNIMVSFASRSMDVYRKVQLYGKKRIRSRVRIYLMTLDETEDGIILPMNRTALAEYLGVDRAALARELGRMQREGLIEVDKRRVRILNRAFFQEESTTLP